jgi:hypothetical protein
MVDPKTTNERSVETEADVTARKVWIKPRLEVASLNDHTENTGPAAGADGGLSVS